MCPIQFFCLVLIMSIKDVFSSTSFSTSSFVLCYVQLLTKKSEMNKKVRNEQTREELGAEETVVQKIKKRRLRWFGHVERMEEKRLPNAALHGHVEGKRSRGRQRKTWMDNVREDLKGRNIDLTRIGEATRNREVWTNLVRASSSAR